MEPNASGPAGHDAPLDSGAPLIRLTCPRCAGTIHTVRDVAAVVCPFCDGRFFVGDEGDVGWLIEPKQPLEAMAEAARRHLRETRRRITRLDPPEGILLPVFWSRGIRLEWALTVESPPAEDAAWLPEVDSPWEAVFDAAVYARTVPAHPLSRHYAGAATRLDAGVLCVLDPDRLPFGYRVLPATLGAEEATRAVERRQEARGSRPGRHAAATAGIDARHRMNRAAMPAALVPFAFRDRDRGAVLVDALTARVLGVVSGTAPPDASGGGRERPGRGTGSVLVPLECGDCGWELALRERDVLQPCTNCGACWELVGGERRRIRQWVMDADAHADRWLPFWLFGDGGSEEEPPPAALLVPAYRGRHVVDQLHLAARLSRRLSGASWKPAWDERLGGAAIGSEEAAAWHWAVTGALSRGSAASFRRFLETAPAPAPRAAGLGWIPFFREGGDLTERATGARVREEGTMPWRLPSAA